MSHELALGLTPGVQEALAATAYPETQVVVRGGFWKRTLGVLSVVVLAGAYLWLFLFMPEVFHLIVLGTWVFQAIAGLGYRVWWFEDALEALLHEWLDAEWLRIAPFLEESAAALGRFVQQERVVRRWAWPIRISFAVGLGGLSLVSIPLRLAEPTAMRWVDLVLFLGLFGALQLISRQRGLYRGRLRELIDSLPEDVITDARARELIEAGRAGRRR